MPQVRHRFCRIAHHGFSASKANCPVVAAARFARHVFSQFDKGKL